MSTKEDIEKKLVSAITLSHIEVINESGKHNVPPGSESHFKLVLVSPEFSSLSLIERHRKINGILADELANKIHALSINAYTDEQWQEKMKNVPDTPPCLGGEKKAG